MAMRTKYVDGMNKIKADNELKQAILRKVSIGAAVPPHVERAFRSKLVMLAVSCIIIVLLVIGGPLVFQQKHIDHSAALFSGFEVMAYAADGDPLIVKPDVDFPLGQYSVFMSIVPGFPITIVSEATDHIELRTSEGQLLLWINSMVLPQGKEVTMKSGDTIYWTPLVEGIQNQAVAENVLEVIAYKNKNIIGSSKIEIKLDDHNMYKGKLLSQ